ncbi:MAG: spore germination protein [Angelakisella sp.]
MQFDTGGQKIYGTVQPQGAEELLPPGLDNLLVAVRARLHNSDDLVVQRHHAGSCRLAVIMFEGQVSNQQVTDYLLEPLSQLPPEVNSGEKLLDYLRNGLMPASDQKEARTYGELFTLAMSGFAVVAIDGQQTAVALGYQGFATRGVGEPSGEVSLKGSREGFSELVVANVALVRRRLKTPMLTVESLTLGNVSNTAVKLLYLSGVASPEMVEEVRRRLSTVKLNILLDSGYLRPFLEDGGFSFFSGVGTTERPDTLCAKLGEGRMGLLVVGTPFALVLPTLFIEHFQTMDDYIQRPYFTAFLRLLKLVSFFATILLPGWYVAVVSFHPELIPEVLLDSFIRSVVYTPLPAVAEALVVFTLYELLREAGLRLPRPIGHAISIVGGLVIGDAAVSAGLVGLPMIILIAVTAISSFVVPSLYEPVTVLRLTFIVVGGSLGLFGVYLGLSLLLVSLCSMTVLGVPVTAPLTPFDAYSLRDMAVRVSWKQLQNKTLEVGKLDKF